MDTLIKDFRRHYFKVRDVCSAFSTTGTFGLKISGTGKEMYAHCETPNEEDTACFAVVMRRFLNPADSIYYKEIWLALQIRFGTEISDNEFQRIEILREQLDSGYAQMKFDGKNLTPAEIYQTISDAGYFDSQEEARLHFQTISLSPAIKQLLLYQFYDYMLSGFALVSSLFTVASRFERVRRLGEKAKVNRCIYCLTSDGSFSAEEHILSEALGSYDTVLARGCVCDACNNGNLSVLDNALASFEPIAWSRVWFVPHNKKGKLPKANFQNFSIEKIGPRLIKFTPKDRTGEIKTIEQIGDDLYRYNVQGRFRGKRIDWQLIGRALYKIALGMVALKQGHEFACNSKFDAARSFIETGQGIRNNLLVKTTFQPHPSMQVTYLDAPGGTLFFIDLFGLAFFLSLENTTVLQSDDEIAKVNFELISLGD